MTSYRVRTACEVAGVWRNTADVFELTDDQARHLLPPYGNTIQPVVTVDPVAPRRRRAAKVESDG